jgi:predicted amidohydrolase
LTAPPLDTGSVRVRIEQFAPALCRPDANLERIAEAQAAAAADGVDLLVTPELALTGYDVRDAVHALARPESPAPFPSLSGSTDVVLGAIEHDAGFVPYNVALHLAGGRVLHRHRKVYLPTYGLFDEARYFGAGDRARTYVWRGWRIGLLVCEDLWHPALTYLHAAGGAHLIIAQTAAAGRGAWSGGPGGGRFASWADWEFIARAAAVTHGVYVVLANRVGVEGGCVFAGGSLIVGPDGGVVARAGDRDEERLTADIDLGAVALARRPFSHLRDDDPHLVRRELDHLLRGEA